MNLMLFDMDNVLIQPFGYYRALEETVVRLARALGFRSAAFTRTEIAAFEAAGSTSEWDTAAICAALLLERAWTQNPETRLPENPLLPEVPLHHLSTPDFQTFAAALAEGNQNGDSPRTRAERLIAAGLAPEMAGQAQILRAILRGARDPHRSLTFRLFQELVIGSRLYAETYGLPPLFHVESYLSRYDQPSLKQDITERLRRWLASPDHSGAIFTNRPSLVLNDGGGTPEAEIGARLAGLETLPMVGMGALTWLSTIRNLEADAYLKPSPVHVLAALRAAMGEPLADALASSAALLDGRANSGWDVFQGAHIHVFEDSAKGLTSACAAQDLLGKQGIVFRLYLYGITESAPKLRALQAVGAEIFPDLEAALEAAIRQT